MNSALKYIAHYPAPLQEQVVGLIEKQQLAPHLARKYPARHQIQTDKALYEYASALKNDYLRNAPPLAKVQYDGKLNTVQHALGLNTQIARVQGNKLKSKNEIRIATLFRATAPEFLRMIVVHELAHLKVKAHDKAFYQLCQHMEPHYLQYEFDLRLHLIALELGLVDGEAR
ncbi:YgjP-like metallopeptidase domain-containing protein [Chitinibacter sp. ZOR0017]|uniref:YgjP-like metallopeptidase domain-containing protein n=1 Tax=Chitinibacter sp. ZOR0017 TaxID=1339254 RepID=UPI00064686E2|nr:YgjP-like metallopeptidase domain-containing protein [Chitinibacter sp. ZOR0017]